MPTLKQEGRSSPKGTLDAVVRRMNQKSRSSTRQPCDQLFHTPWSSAGTGGRVFLMGPLSRRSNGQFSAQICLCDPAKRPLRRRRRAVEALSSFAGFGQLEYVGEIPAVCSVRRPRAGELVYCPWRGLHLRGHGRVRQGRGRQRLYARRSSICILHGVHVATRPHQGPRGGAGKRSRLSGVGREPGAFGVTPHLGGPQGTFVP